jgi:hypothetical protein
MDDSMLLAMKVDMIILHEKEEKRAKTESRLGGSDWLCLLAMHAQLAGSNRAA